MTNSYNSSGGGVQSFPKTNQMSSSSELFLDNPISCKMAEPCDPESHETRTLKAIALRLRRAKRSLLLSAASTDGPISPQESLRTVVMHLSDVADEINYMIPEGESSSSL
jgi:hypothetical protein